jgi:hypothetical protein
MAVAYAPTPKKAIWARLTCPAMPITRPMPTASKANRIAVSATLIQ